MCQRTSGLQRKAANKPLCLAKNSQDLIQKKAFLHKDSSFRGKSKNSCYYTAYFEKSLQILGSILKFVQKSVNIGRIYCFFLGVEKCENSFYFFCVHNFVCEGEKLACHLLIFLLFFSHY